MQGIKRNINTSEDMRKKQQRLDNQLKGIEQQKRQNIKRAFSNHSSIAHVAESPSIGTQLKSIRNKSKNIKNMFSNGFKNAADSFVEKEIDLEFEEGCVPI